MAPTSSKKSHAQLLGIAVFVVAFAAGGATGGGRFAGPGGALGKKSAGMGLMSILAILR